ncbi:MAG: Protein kinase domain [Chlamydiales bacterium]|jgi:hypothetical protein|nr:Protein kinase domain [Chlamydiales bacterium]
MSNLSIPSSYSPLPAHSEEPSRYKRLSVFLGIRKGAHLEAHKSMPVADQKAQVVAKKILEASHLTKKDLAEHGIALSLKGGKTAVLRKNYVPLHLAEDGKLIKQSVKTKEVAMIFNLPRSQIKKFEPTQLSEKMKEILHETNDLADQIILAQESSLPASLSLAPEQKRALLKTLSEAMRSPTKEPRLLQVADISFILAGKTAYVILPEDPIGVGADSAIKKVYNTALKTLEVLKMDRYEMAASEESAVEREAKVLQELHGPKKDIEGIVHAPKLFFRLIDTTAAKQSAALIDLYQGDLEGKEGVYPTQKIGTEAKLQGGSSLLKGLAFLHSQDVAHQDIKPGNVLYRKEGRAFDFRLADFDGILDLRKSTEVRPVDIAHTKQFVPVGMELKLRDVLSVLKEENSQEAKDQLKQLLKAKDLFCMGCVLYQMLADRPAFSQESLISEGFFGGHIQEESQVDLTPLKERGYPDQLIDLLGEVLDVKGSIAMSLDAETFLKQWEEGVVAYQAEPK